jgi:hypothetical protein
MKFNNYLIEKYIFSVRRLVWDKHDKKIDAFNEVYQNPSKGELLILRKEFIKLFNDSNIRFLYDYKNEDLYVFNSQILHSEMKVNLRKAGFGSGAWSDGVAEILSNGKLNGILPTTEEVKKYNGALAKYF